MRKVWYHLFCIWPETGRGEMSEWLKEPVLKTGDVEASVGSNPTLSASFITGLRKYPSGRRGSPAKGVGRETVARVQIPPSAPNPEVFTGKDFGIFYSRKSLALILGGPYPPAKTPYSIASAIWRRRVTDQPKLICEFCVKFIIDGLHFPLRAYILKLSIKERRLVQYGMVQQHRRFRRG